MESETSSVDQISPQLEHDQAAMLVDSQLAEEKSARRTQIILVGGGILFLVILVAIVALLYTNPQATEVIRDIAIVFVSVVSFLIGLALILLIFQIQVLIRVLRDEIQPLLSSVNDTAATVRGTTDFVSHNVVSPFIKFAGFSAAVRQVTSDLVTVARGTRPRSKPTQKPSEGGSEYV